jgi:DivIVA domain-containing protein
VSELPVEVLPEAPVAAPAEERTAPAARAVRGYDRRQVDAFLTRCAQALSPDGSAHSLDQIPHPRVTREEVDEVVFQRRWGGYDVGHIDALLDRIARVLPSGITGTMPVVRPAPLKPAWFGYSRREVDAFLWLCRSALGPDAVHVGLPAAEVPQFVLAPQAVRAAVFSRGLRGYAMGSVDLLLDAVETRLRA